MIIGSIMLIDSPIPAMQISLSVIIPAVLLTAGFFLFAMYLYYKAHNLQPTTGREGMIGEIGLAVTKIHHSGTAKVHGERWSVTSNEPIKKGEKVQVVSVEGIKLIVEHIKNKEV